MRTRLLPLVLAPVLAVLTLAPIAPSAAVAAPSTAQQVSDLNGEVARVAARLAEGSAALEEGQARLAEVRARAEQVRRAATAAAARAGASQARLEDFVGASYRTPRPGAFSMALSGAAGMTERLHATASLEQVQGRQQDLAAEAEADRVRAEQLLDEAEGLEADAAARERALAAKVEELKEEAEQARLRLEQARERLEAEQAAARKARAEAEAAARARASRERAAAAARRSAPSAASSAPAPAPAGKVSGKCGGGSLEGYPNGMLPASALCELDGTNGLLLRADAAAAFNRMAAAGGMPCAGNSYRSYSQQVALYRVKPSLAAVPGTSNHGWGVAVDFACGAEQFGTAGYRWLKANGPKYGWTHPSWAEPGGSRPEPWHWEYTG